MSNLALQPQKVQGYGWRKQRPDSRDRIFNNENVIKAPSQVPKEVDLSPQMPPIYDQGQLGSCTGNGWARVMEYMAMRDNQAADTPSRLFIYFNERVIENTVSSDSGAEIRDGAKVVATLGVPSETLCPYDISKFAERPSDQAYAEAKKDIAVVYKSIVLGGPGAPMRSAIAAGFPIVYGFPVPDYFEGSWDPTTEPLPLPGDSPNWIGGHCVVITGYDFSLTRFHVPAFLCDNSWGSSWGIGGRFWMDYRWFNPDQSLASDLWIVEKVSV